MVLFLDTNIIIDLLIQRSGSDLSKKFLSYSLHHDFFLYISNITVINCFYILRKEFTNEELIAKFKDIFKIIHLVSSGHEEIFNSLNNNRFSDFEDCFQAECAKKLKASFIITNNVKDFTFSEISAATPQDFLDTILLI